MKEYNNNVFPRSLCITQSINEANELFDCPFTDDKKFVWHEDAMATTYCANYKDRNSGCLLLLINTELDIRTICHESLHITRTMLEDLPCNLNDETEEVWCYLIGWVADSINDFINDKQ